MKNLALAFLVLFSTACLKQPEEQTQASKQQVTRDPITGRTVMSGTFDVPVKIDGDKFVVLKTTSRTLKNEGNECLYKTEAGTSTYDIVNGKLIFSSGTQLDLVHAGSRGGIYGLWSYPTFTENGLDIALKFDIKRVKEKKVEKDVMTVKLACSY